MAARSTEQFLTTHTGSLPRPDGLMRMMFAKADGVPVDAAALEEAVGDAVRLMVDRQAAAGIDIVNDGEMSKPSYATYIKDRLDGFGGESGSYTFQDLDEFPGTKAKVFADAGRSRRRAPACTAPITVKDMEAPRRDAERLIAAANGRADLHERGLAGRHRPVLPQRALSEPRGLSVRARRRAAPRI